MKSSNTKTTVLLCGTQYGQTYLPALFDCQELELAGILARGSERSIRLSEQYGVPLYNTVTELEKTDETFDIACVAVNDTVATPLATALLQRGTSVLVEHPVSADNITKLLAAAKNYGGICHINSHFSTLPCIVQFISLCQRLNQLSTPLCVNISCNSRTLFSTLDIVLRCFGNLNINEFALLHQTKTQHTESNRHYSVATLQLQQTPCTLTYQNWRGQLDNSQDAPLGHHIVITYPEGTLTLGGTFGPTLWAPLISAGAQPCTPVYSQVDNDIRKAPTMADIIQWRKFANQRAILNLLTTVTGLNQHSENKTQSVHPKNTPISFAQAFQTPDNLQTLCNVWTALNKQLGPHQTIACAPILSPTMWQADTLLTTPYKSE